MNTINLESIGFKEMTTQETLMVEGGHDGTAYQIGKALHSVITRLADVATSIIGALL